MTRKEGEGEGERTESCAGTVVLLFFQAEDGIRDLTVTGVQTCALPISSRPYRRGAAGVRADRAGARAPHREGETGFPEAPDRRADRPERLRVRRPRLFAPTAGRTRRGEGEGRLARQGGGRPPRDRRGGRRFRGAPRPLAPPPPGPHRPPHAPDPPDRDRE